MQKVSQINASLIKKSNLGETQRNSTMRERKKETDKSIFLCMNVNGRK